eukprot:13985296-Heterocapsa_arctica.AAC.1
MVGHPPPSLSLCPPPRRPPFPCAVKRTDGGLAAARKCPWDMGCVECLSCILGCLGDIGSNCIGQKGICAGLHFGSRHQQKRIPPNFKSLPVPPMWGGIASKLKPGGWGGNPRTRGSLPGTRWCWPGCA